MEHTILKKRFSVAIILWHLSTGGQELWQELPPTSTACSCVTLPFLLRGAWSRKKPLAIVTVLENGRMATTQTVTTPTASHVSCIPSSWSVAALSPP